MESSNGFPTAIAVTSDCRGPRDVFAIEVNHLHCILGGVFYANEQIASVVNVRVSILIERKGHPAHLINGDIAIIDGSGPTIRLEVCDVGIVHFLHVHFSRWTRFVVVVIVGIERDAGDGITFQLRQFGSRDNKLTPGVVLQEGEVHRDLLIQFCPVMHRQRCLRLSLRFSSPREAEQYKG